MRKFTVAALAAGMVLAAPSVASAEMYLSKPQAESDMRDYARSTYSASSPAASCRPQGLNAPEPGYVYTRWVCGWADVDGCEGRVLIIGSARGRGWYRARVLHGQRCPAA